MRYSGVLGIIQEVEEKPGKWKEVPVEHPVLGDVEQKTDVLVLNDRIIPGHKVNTSISVFSRGLGLQDNSHIRYVTFKGKRWTIESIVDDPPKITIYIGEEYHGPIPDGPPDDTE